MISKLENKIAFRYLKTRKKDGFLNVISIFSFIGISLGVAVLIIVMSVMNGFRSELVNKILGFKRDLKYINLNLWDIEDGKRSAEKNNRFDDKFIQLARNVYKFNDERAKIKLEINNALGSNIKEVKSYE